MSSSRDVAASSLRMRVVSGVSVEMEDFGLVEVGRELRRLVGSVMMEESGVGDGIGCMWWEMGVRKRIIVHLLMRVVRLFIPCAGGTAIV